MSETIVVGMVHDPEGRYPALLDRDLPPLMERCAALCAICGAGTSPRTADALRACGVEVVAGPDIPLNARPYALRLIAARPEWRHVHLTDLDHALHWARYLPDELVAVHRQIAAHDFLLLGRTTRATATLPDFQRETERLINVMFAATTTGFAGWHDEVCSASPMDICTGAWGLSRRAVLVLSARARITDVGFHAEWPLIVRDTSSLRAGYLPCEGLEYETADRYEDAIAAAGGIDAWHAAQHADIARWRYRLAYVTQIADAIAAYNTGRGPLAASRT